MTDDSDLVLVLYDGIRHFLKTTPEASIAIIVQRLADFDAILEFWDDFLDVDAAVSVLTKEDQDSQNQLIKGKSHWILNHNLLL